VLSCRRASASWWRSIRASLVDPDVLVLDEATSSVDALTEVRLTRALETAVDAAAPRSRSPTACRPQRAPIACWCSTTAGSWRTDRTPSWSSRGGAYARMYEAWVAATSSSA
jgi:ATP-binding cassette subfamily B protein